MARNYSLLVKSDHGRTIVGGATTEAEGIELLTAQIKTWRQAGALVHIPRGYLGVWVASCHLDGTTYTARVIEQESTVPLLARLQAV